MLLLVIYEQQKRFKSRRVRARKKIDNNTKMNFNFFPHCARSAFVTFYISAASCCQTFYLNSWFYRFSVDFQLEKPSDELKTGSGAQKPVLSWSAASRDSIWVTFEARDEKIDKMQSRNFETEELGRRFKTFNFLVQSVAGNLHFKLIFPSTCNKISKISSTGWIFLIDIIIKSKILTRMREVDKRVRNA